MRAGELRHRLTLQQPVETVNDFGETVISYSDVDTVWGAVDPNAGKRYFEAMQANSEIQGAIRLRYRSDIEATWRILYGTRVLQIISIINPKERDQELLVYYKEALD